MDLQILPLAIIVMAWPAGPVDDDPGHAVARLGLSDLGRAVLVIGFVDAVAKNPP